MAEETEALLVVATLELQFVDPAMLLPCIVLLNPELLSTMLDVAEDAAEEVVRLVTDSDGAMDDLRMLLSGRRA